MFKSITVVAALLVAVPAMASSQLAGNPSKVNSWQFCARPLVDSFSMQPLIAVSNDTSSIGPFGDGVAGFPFLFFPWQGPPSNETSGPFINWGYYGNVMSGDFGFKTDIVDCISAAAGNFNASSGAQVLGQLYGSCQAIDGHRVVPINRRLEEVQRQLQQLGYLTNELYCKWTAVLVPPVTPSAKSLPKPQPPTIITGATVRSALQIGFDHIESATGMLAKSQATLSSMVMNAAPVRRLMEEAQEAAQGHRKLQIFPNPGEDPFASAYTQWTVTYPKGRRGWNPYYTKPTKA